MKSRIVFILAMLLMAFAASGAVTKGEKMQVVYRAQPTGEWDLYVFGPRCEGGMKMQVVQPAEPTDPIKVLCSIR